MPSTDKIRNYAQKSMLSDRINRIIRLSNSTIIIKDKDFKIIATDVRDHTSVIIIIHHVFDPPPSKQDVIVDELTKDGKDMYDYIPSRFCVYEEVKRADLVFKFDSEHGCQYPQDVTLDSACLTGFSLRFILDFKAVNDIYRYLDHIQPSLKPRKEYRMYDRL